MCGRQLIPKELLWEQKELIKNILKHFKGYLGRNLNIFNSPCKKGIKIKWSAFF